MILLIVGVFVLGYLAIAFEHLLGINKAAFALISGVLCWTILILGTHEKELVNEQLLEHMGEISGILFFLLGAMVIVELIDLHDGFDMITQQIKTTKKRELLWLVCWITFFLSALLDNLTTTIVMVSLLKKLIDDSKSRLLFAGMIVIAANAGGAWSPLGDVTTTMLWIGGQITPVSIVSNLFLPSLICILLPITIVSYRLRGNFPKYQIDSGRKGFTTSRIERRTVFFTGIGTLIFVPIFKTFTHLPPMMGILIGLGVMWVLTELLHSTKGKEDKDSLSVASAISKIDSSSILFFLGILLSVSALQAAGVLASLAETLTVVIHNDTLTVVLLGLLSAIVDNVPLVAAAQGMYTLEHFPTDHQFWQFLAYCTGVGGSSLIIGSAAGVAAMGMEKIEFFWYLKNISIYAIIGFFSGALVYLVQYSMFHV
ncbi:MAG: sodium:proton antiporter NhaD [Flavobacteriales bacterium]|nr:sodium:proton antiporter NhaD [Flavobacteriales bacterium]